MPASTRCRVLLIYVVFVNLVHFDDLVNVLHCQPLFVHNPVPTNARSTTDSCVQSAVRFRSVALVLYRQNIILLLHLCGNTG